MVTSPLTWAKTTSNFDWISYRLVKAVYHISPSLLVSEVKAEAKSPPPPGSIHVLSWGAPRHALKKKHSAPSTLAGGIMQLLWVFFFLKRPRNRWADRAEVWHSLCGIICAFFGQRKLTGSGQVTELWRHKRHSFQPIFQGNRAFSRGTCCQLTGMGALCMIQVSTWPHVTFDIAKWPSKGNPRSLTLADPMHTNSG